MIRSSTLAWLVGLLTSTAAATAMLPFAAHAASPASSVASAPEVQIHVATDGNDSSTGESPAGGSADGPVRSLARAQALARSQSAAMATGLPRRPIRVLIAPGTYPLSAPLTFGPADSGTAAAPVSYEAVTAGTVTLSGGVKLAQRNPATPAAAAIFDLPAAASGTWRGGGQLFVNGQRATLARQPKAGQYWFMQRAVALDTEPAGDGGHEAFTPSAEAAAWFSRLPSAERSRAIVNVMHSWTSSVHHLAEAAAPAGAIRLSPRAQWAFLSTGASQRYFVENIPSALDSAGEWVATATEVRYRPTAVQAGTALDAVLPVLDRLVVIRGDAATGQPVQHLAFRGLGFAHTRQLIPDGGFIDPQAAIALGAAFEADHAQFITIDRCSFSGIGAYAVWLRQSVRDSRISQSDFSDLGAGGIQIGVPREKPGETTPSSRNLIEGNRIGNIGMQFPGAVAIWLGQGYDNTVSHNLIHDTFYTGISVGWTWGFGPAASGRHHIVDNLLVNIGQGQLSDMGGIYTLGNLAGTVVSGNLIREVRAYPGYGPGRGLGGWGIYNDLGSSEVLVENNVVVGTDSGGYHLNGGRQNTVRQNVFAGGGKAEIRSSRASGHSPQATLEGNLIIGKASQPLDGLAASPDIVYTGNQVSGALSGGAPDLGPCGGGCRASQAGITVAAEPKAISFKGLDAATTARLARVVQQAGPLDTTTASPGKRVLVQVTALANTVAPPQPVAVNLQSARLGSQPAGLSYNPVGDTQAIRLVENASAPEGRCLQFNDSPALPNRWDPHAFAKLSHETGTEVVEFSLLIDANSDFVHEWRDDDRPYHAGPSLHIGAAGVSVAGKVVAPATVGQWMHVRVVSPLGKPGARWQLELRDAAGKTYTVPNLLPVSPLWQSLDYLGYISNANQISSLCLAGIKASNSIGQ